MPWTSRLREPIALRDGRRIETLADARALMLDLPEFQQLRPWWQYAGELALAAADDDGELIDAWAQLRRALQRDGMI